MLAKCDPLHAVKMWQRFYVFENMSRYSFNFAQSSACQKWRFLSENWLQLLEGGPSISD